MTKAMGRTADRSTGEAARAGARTVHCPTCQRGVAWDGNPHRPFCSLTCRLIDLGAWLDERYRIHADEPPDVSS